MSPPATLPLRYRSPYNWPALMRFLMPRATPGVEQATPDCYRRVLPGGWVEVRPDSRNRRLNASVHSAAVDLAELATRLHLLFDTAAPIRRIEKHLGCNPGSPSPYGASPACAFRRVGRLRVDRARRFGAAGHGEAPLP